MDAAEWHLIAEFVGLDLEDEAILDALAPRPGLLLLLSSSEDVTTVDATIAADSLEVAVGILFDMVTSAAPSCMPVRLVDPLVSISDIAEEAGVTRQGVRSWAVGTRQSGFPRPLATVGDGIRVWRLADVDSWLSAAVGLGSGRRHPTAADVAVFNRDLCDLLNDVFEAGGGGDESGMGAWQEVSTETLVQQATAATTAGRVARDVEADLARR